MTAPTVCSPWLRTIRTVSACRGLASHRCRSFRTSTPGARKPRTGSVTPVATGAAGPLECTLTVLIDELYGTIASPGAGVARATGQVRAPFLAPAPLAVTNGIFQLFVRDPAHVETRLMIYGVPLT